MDILKYLLATYIIIILICCLSFCEQDMTSENVKQQYKIEKKVKNNERGTPNRGW